VIFKRKETLDLVRGLHIGAG